uniref:Uncharacterized protein n=1 Tax=Romanomermis culicivorax TaxID=13658 RepID=A0A915KJY5_ROMCU
MHGSFEKSAENSVQSPASATAPMDVEPARSSSRSLLPTAMWLPPTTRTSATKTTIMHTMSLPPTAPTSVQTTTPAQLPLVIRTRPVLGVALPTDTGPRFEPHLPS